MFQTGERSYRGVHRAINESYPSSCCSLSHTPLKVHLAHTHLRRSNQFVTPYCTPHLWGLVWGGVFWGNTSRQSPASVRQSNLCKHTWRLLAGAAGRGGLAPAGCASGEAAINRDILELNVNLNCIIIIRYLHRWVQRLRSKQGCLCFFGRIKAPGLFCCWRQCCYCLVNRLGNVLH